MGWNTISEKANEIIFKDIFEPKRFYFVHSYFVCPRNEEDVISITNYGLDFVSAIKKENIMGVQFHPEKSHRYGMKLLENFCYLL